MALLAFRVEADYEEAINMRKEVERLEKELRQATFGTKQWEKLNGELADTRRSLNELVSDAARSGAEMKKAFHLEDVKIVDKINTTRKALSEERLEIKRLSDVASVLEQKMDAALAKKNHKREYKALVSEYSKVIAELDSHKVNEGAFMFDLSELQVQRAQNIKESELYKYIMEGAQEGSVDAADAIRENFGDVFDELSEGGNKIGSIFNDILTMSSGVALGNLISGSITEAYGQLKGVYDKALNVRAEMQDIERTMNIFLGSAEKSQQFVSELEDAAYYNMFEFSDLVEGSKQMLAYGHAVDTIIPRLNQLSEVATATHKPIGGLVDMYNRAKSIGYVDSRMQQSFASQGVVIKDVLKEMGVAATGTKISFTQLNQVLDYLTAEGGKFHGIMASQLNNISAEEGALEDALHSMYNEMGQMFEGARIKSLKMQQGMVNNWKEIAKWTTIAVTTLGTYRTALLFMRASQTAFNTQLGLQKIATMGIAMASTAEAKAKLIQKAATDAETQAQLINNVAKNNATRAAIIHNMALNDDAKLNLIVALGLDKETESQLVNTLATETDTVAKGANAGAAFTLSGALKTLTGAIKANTMALLTNPYVILAAAIAGLIAVITMYVMSESEEEKVTREVDEEQKRYTDTLKARREEEKRLLDAVNDVNSSEWERLEAFKELHKELPTLAKDYAEWMSLSDDERKKRFEKAQKERVKNEEAARYSQVERALDYSNMRGFASFRNVGQGSYREDYSLSQEDYKEYESLRTNNKRTEEEQKRFEALLEKGRQNAEAMKGLYQEINPEGEGKTVTEAVRWIGEWAEKKKEDYETIKKQREEEEYRNKPIQERLDLETEALEKAKKERDAVIAVYNAQKRRTASLKDLIDMGNKEGLDVAQWQLDPTIDEESLRKKIIDALAKIDQEKLGVEVVPEVDDTNEGFLENAKSAFESIGFTWGADLVDKLIQGEQKGVVNAAEDKVKQAQNKLKSTQSEKDSLTTPREIQRQAKENERRLKNIQQKVASSTLSADDLKAVQDLIAEEDKWKNLVKSLADNGQLTAADYATLNEQLQQALNNQKTSYTNSGGDEAEKAAQRAYELRKMQVENEKKIARTRVEVAYDVEQNIINAMREGSEKTLKQRDLDHRKEMTKLEQQREDKIKEAEETAKSVWLKQSENNKEYNWDSVKQGVLSTSQVYKDLEKAANDAYEAQKNAANIKFNDVQDLRSKYDKGRYDYEKEEAELASNLQRLYDTRDSIDDKLRELQNKAYSLDLTTTEGTQELEMIENEIDNLNTQKDDTQRMINEVVHLQQVLLTTEQKALEEYVKSFGTAEEKIEQIAKETARKLSDPNLTQGQRATILRQDEASRKKILEEISKDNTYSYNDRQSMVTSGYAEMQKRIDDEITEYHRQALDMRLSDEERANAMSLAQSAESQKARMDREQKTMSAQLAVEGMKNDPTYFKAFRDMTNISSKALENLNRELEKNADELKNLDPEQLKTITDLMNKIDDTVSERDPFGAMSRHMKEAERAQQEYIASQAELAESEAELARARVNYNMAVLESKLAAESGDESRMTTANQRLIEAEKNLNVAKERNANAQNRVKNAVIATSTAMGKVDKDSKKIRSTFKEWGSIIKGIGEQFDSILGNALVLCGDIMDILMDASQTIADVQDGALDKIGKGDTPQMPKDKSDDKGEGGEGGGSEDKASLMGTFSSIMQGAQLGMAVGQKIVGFLSGIIENGEAKYEKYREKVHEVNKLTDSIKRYQHASLLAQQAEKSWFGNSPLRDLQNQWESAQQTQKDYYDKLSQRQAAYRNQSRHDGDWMANVVVGSFVGAGIAALTALTGGAATAGAIAGAAALGGLYGGASGAVVTGLEQGLLNNDYNEQTKRAIDNLRIETRAKKSSFMWIGGHDQETADLRTWVKQKYGEDLFDPKTNQINIELAEEVIATYGDKLQGETQATMEEMIELAKQYEEYQEALKEYVNSLYSPLTDNMVDAIWSWYDEGRDALSAFKESASSTFRAIVNDLMKQIVLKNIVGTFQDDIKELYDKYNAGEMDQRTLIRQVALKTKDMTEAYEQSVPLLQEMVTTMSDTIKDITGVSISDSAGGGSSSGGGAFSGMSQDVGNEMNGRLTAIQIGVDNIEGGLNTLTVNSMAMLNYASEQSVAITGIQQQIATSYLELQGIHEDTSSMVKSMKDMNEYMYNWDSHVKKL